MSPISTSGKPATTNRSPARQLVDLVAADTVERHQLREACASAAADPRRTLPRATRRSRRGASTPLTTRPMARRPRYSLASSCRDHRLQRCRHVAGRRRNRFEDRVEQRRQVVVVAGHADALHGSTLTGDGGDDLEVDVMVAGVEVDEQLVDLVEHLVGASVLAVDLVDDDDRPAGRAPAPSAARSGSAAADPRRHRRAAAHRRPSSALARPRHRSRRDRACRPG